MVGKFYLGIDIGTANCHVSAQPSGISSGISYDIGGDISHGITTVKFPRTAQQPEQHWPDYLPNLMLVRDESAKGHSTKGHGAEEHEKETHDIEAYGWEAQQRAQQYQQNNTPYRLYRSVLRELFYPQHPAEQAVADASRSLQQPPALQRWQKQLVHLLLASLDYLKHRFKHEQCVLAGLTLTLPPINTAPQTESETKAQPQLSQQAMQAVQQALTQAGQAECPIRVINAPLAAQLDMLSQIAIATQRHGTGLVIDIGASSVDVSICRSSKQQPLHLLCNYSTECAGDYFDRQLAKSLAPNLSDSELQPLVDSVRAAKQAAENRETDAFIQQLERLFSEHIQTDAQQPTPQQALTRLLEQMSTQITAVIADAMLQSGMQQNAQSLDWLLICGGMSGLGHGFLSGAEYSLTTQLERQIPMLNISAPKGSKNSAKNSVEWIKPQWLIHAEQQHRQTQPQSNLQPDDPFAFEALEIPPADLNHQALRHWVANGAARLAANPALLTDRLAWHLTTRIELQHSPDQPPEYRHIVLFRAGTELNTKHSLDLAHVISEQIQAEYPEGELGVYSDSVALNGDGEIPLFWQHPQAPEQCYRLPLQLAPVPPQFKTQCFRHSPKPSKIHLRYRVKCTLDSSSEVGIEIYSTEDQHLVSRGKLAANLPLVADFNHNLLLPEESGRC